MQYRNTFIQEIRLWVKHGFFILIASLILGEAVFRLPWVPGLLSYEFDDELGWQLSPGQIGSLFMGSLSYLSKPITINTDGYRNGPLYWNAPMVICLGSSEALGTGVAEDSVWTARLSALLQPGHPGMMVVNAGGPGYGPYHDLIRLKRFMARKKPALAVVRVSLGDRNFYPPSPSELRGLKSKSDRNRIIRSFSRFLPFLVNKIQAQASAISEIFRGSGKSQVYASEAESEEVGSQMWENQRKYWRAMVDDCNHQAVPLVFLVDDPLDTDGGRVLENRLRTEFPHPSVQVLRLDGGLFHLQGRSREERRRDYQKRYTMFNDPHANDAKHATLADFLFYRVTWQNISTSLRESDIPTP